MHDGLAGGRGLLPASSKVMRTHVGNWRETSARGSEREQPRRLRRRQPRSGALSGEAPLVPGCVDMRAAAQQVSAA